MEEKCNRKSKKRGFEANGAPKNACFEKGKEKRTPSGCFFLYKIYLIYDMFTNALNRCGYRECF